MLSALLIALASHVAVAADGIAFGPVRAQPGESVRLTSRSECREGVLELTRDGKTTKEVMRFYRERELSWTVREPAADGTLRGMVEIGKMNTFTTTTIGQVMVDLKTMLDESLELEGVLETRSGKVSTSKKANLPIRLVVNKTFAKGAGF